MTASWQLLTRSAHERIREGQSSIASATCYSERESLIAVTMAALVKYMPKLSANFDKLYNFTCGKEIRARIRPESMSLEDNSSIQLFATMLHLCWLAMCGSVLRISPLKTYQLVTYS